MTATRMLECEKCRDLGVVIRERHDRTPELMGCGQCPKSFDPSRLEQFQAMVIERLIYLEQQLSSAQTPKRSGTHAAKRKRKASPARD